MKPLQLTGTVLFSLFLAAGNLGAAADTPEPQPSVPARLTGIPNRNPIPNGSFEKCREGQPADWRCGTAHCVSEPAKVYAGNSSCEVRISEGKTSAAIYTAPNVSIQRLARYRFSVWAKGSGRIRLGYSFLYRLPGGKKQFQKMMQPNAVTLNEDWQEVSYLFKPTHPAASAIKLWITLKGESAVATLDAAELTRSDEPSASLTVIPSHPMGAVGEDVTLTIPVVQDGEPARKGTLKILLQTPDGKGTSFELPIDTESRTTTYRIPADAISQPGLYKALAVHKESDAAQWFSIDVLQKDEYAAFEKAGPSAVIAPLPAHVLILGDSLTDFDRGHNWVDKMSAWLTAKYGSQVTVRNGAVGGDVITRVAKRLTTPSGGYKAERYDGLLTKKPTHILIFLGHNDSKVTSASDYSEPVVSLADFEQAYREVITFLRQGTGAEIMLMSSTSSDYEKTSARAARARGAGRRHNFFGVPEMMEQFNATTRKIASDTGCDYIDVYGPTRDHPEKTALYDHSGVHLANKGHRVLALEVLKFLGQDNGQAVSQ